MLRLPNFRYHAPRSVSEVVDLLAADPHHAMVVAGGTDLLPNMKRRQQTPLTLVGLRHVAGLRELRRRDDLTVGACVTLAEIVRELGRSSPRDGALFRYGALWQAAAQVATPQLRNMGTIGGNLCLDTRCNYYDQSYEWRKAIDFCMKKDGGICWVATSSPKCLAVSSTDTAPALMALGASVSLASAGGSRQIALSDLYRNDGIQYLTRQPTELLTTVHVPELAGWRSTYWKLRRRGAFDFPVLSVAVATKTSGDGTVEDARLVLGAVASRPLLVPEVTSALIGKALDDEVIEHAAEVAAHPARPMDNTDFSLIWRKRMTRDLASYALRELRGDDTRALRRRLARQELLVQ
jgi:4-hydroxybenzoyl-CoA reductase subunit beta